MGTQIPVTRPLIDPDTAAFTPPHPGQSLCSTVKALTSTARMTAGTNPQEFVKILYMANDLPTFNIPEEVFNTLGSTPATDPLEDADSSPDDDSATSMRTSDFVLVPSAHKTLPPDTPTSATVPVANHDITVNAATLSDFLSAPAPHVSPAVADPSPVQVVNLAAMDPWCDPVEGIYYENPSAAIPTTANQPSRTQPLRSTTSGLHSSDEPDEDVSVGTPSPPSRKCHYSAADFLHDTAPTTPNDSTTKPAQSQTTKTETDKPKKKTKDQSLLKSSTKKKTTNAMI
ncbi:uncharacterized protein [Procambarus clarkii]|uniref:uncharacterized protein n=1 Tax=Procambarus clarkii TaxID=6728 RepID=UPI003744A787